MRPNTPLKNFLYKPFSITQFRIFNAHIIHSMSKSIKLSIEPYFEFFLIGFVTSEPLYRLSWLINEMLEIQLKETAPIKAYHPKRLIIQEFSLFQFIGEDNTRFQLFQNKNMHGHLIEEQKQADYWLKIEDSSISIEYFILKLKTIKNINLIFEVKPGSLKSKLRLLFSDDKN